VNYFYRLSNFIKAIRGNPTAQYNVATLMDQKDDPESKHRAFTWFKHAADQGHSAACMYLIRHYIHINDNKSAIEYLKLSLPSQNAVNESLLGQMLLNGYTQYIDHKQMNEGQNEPVTELDNYIQSLYPNNAPILHHDLTDEEAANILKESLDYLKQGIEQNNSLAQHAFAIYTLEYNTKLTKSETNEALNLLEQAANKNFAPSLQVLAGIYENGLYGFKPDINKGLRLRIEASETGSKEAQYSLGILVYKGNGFSQNRSQGMKLINMAAAQGHSEAIDFLKSVEG
jgi:TPR repeat protein